MKTEILYGVEQSSGIAQIAERTFDDPRDDAKYREMLWSISAKEEAVRRALIELGWMPPERDAVRLADPELVRTSIGIIKRMAQTRVPAYELPADSFIENAVIDIINLARNST